MGYWRIALPVWFVVSAVSFVVAVAMGYSVLSGLGWFVGWFTVVLGMRWAIHVMGPYAEKGSP